MASVQTTSASAQSVVDGADVLYGGGLASQDLRNDGLITADFRGLWPFGSADFEIGYGVAEPTEQAPFGSARTEAALTDVKFSGFGKATGRPRLPYLQFGWQWHDRRDLATSVGLGAEGLRVDAGLDVMLTEKVPARLGFSYTAYTDYGGMVDLDMAPEKHLFRLELVSRF